MNPNTNRCPTTGERLAHHICRLIVDHGIGHEFMKGLPMKIANDYSFSSIIEAIHVAGITGYPPQITAAAEVILGTARTTRATGYDEGLELVEEAIAGCT